MLLKHAKSKGAYVIEGSKVNSIDFVSDKEVIVHTIDQNLTTQKYHSKIVVDASGRSTFLGNKLKMKVKDPNFNQCAFHAWFENFDRHSNKNPDHIYIHFVPANNTWIWQIPITEETTSIELVTRKENFPKNEADRENYFWNLVKAIPEFEKKILNSKQVTDFKVEADYSYAMNQICGDNYLLIGDAARFVDPIFSSGVSIALNSARFASFDIINALKSNSYKKKDFSNYSQIITNGCAIWYRFIGLYYRLNVLFTYFVNHKKHRLEILRLLQGDVYETSDDSVLNEMEKMVEHIENNPKHPLHNFLQTLANTSAGEQN